MKAYLRKLEINELSLIWQYIDRSELITQNYVWKQQQLILVDCFYDVQAWDEYHLTQDPPLLKLLMQQGASCVGAFVGERLLGVQMVSNQHIVDYPQAKLLQYFYVDAQHQAMGVGRLLMQSAVEEAKKLGAKQLYISATPTKRTVDFYLKQGAIVLTDPDQLLWDKEPDDIHLLHIIN